MPLLALCANVSWEFIFSFILPASAPQLYINFLWFSLDTIIVIQFLIYGKRYEFPKVSYFNFYFGFTLVVILSFTIILFGSLIINDKIGVYAAFGQNLLMSILFIRMLYKRNSLRGQSIFIAVFKMLGTGLTSLHFYLFEQISFTTLILPILYMSIFIVDIAYVILIVNHKNKDNKEIIKM